MLRRGRLEVKRRPEPVVCASCRRASHSEMFRPGRKGFVSPVYAYLCTYNIAHAGCSRSLPGLRLGWSRRMPFLEPETALAATISGAGMGRSSAEKFPPCARWGSHSRNFQQLARRLNELAKGTAGSSSEGQASRGRLSPQEPFTHILRYQRGVTAFISSGYNDLVMSTVSDAAQPIQFAFARVLAALLSVPAALSRESAVASASKSVR
jgi:hypothetical protein